MGTPEDVEEKNQTDDAVPPETDDILDFNINICTRRITSGSVSIPDVDKKIEWKN